MKLLIFLFLLVLFVPLGAQLRTRYYALPTVARRWSTAFIAPRWALRIELVRR